VTSGEYIAAMVDVKVIGPTERIVDRKYLLIVYEDHAMIVDADKGSTRIVPLDARWMTGPDRATAIIDSARRVAEIEKIPVVYRIDYPPQSGSESIQLPE
jgi:hypothetical protein